MVKNRASGKKNVTIRDVVIHMQGMEQRLTKRIDGVENGLSVLSKKIDANTSRINEVESNLLERINGLDQDIMATMNDTVHIRRHVGMALPDDE